MRELPLIDLSGVNLDGTVPGEVARQVDEACRSRGFFLIEGHGVHPELRSRLDHLARAFFALCDEEKAEISMERGGRAWRGWFPLGAELTSGIPDAKEGLYFGTEHGTSHPRVQAGELLHGANLFPARPAELAPAVGEYLAAMAGLAQRVLRVVAVGLGLEADFFSTGICREPVELFRIFRYPSLDARSDGFSVGPHTDYGLLTILGQDGTGGLELLSAGEWVEVPGDAGPFVCNLGDMLERLTGGTYVSTLHRVRNRSGAERLSFPYFFDPGVDAVVEAAPLVARPTEVAAAERWDDANLHGFAGTYGEYLRGKVAKVFPGLAEGPAGDS